MAAAVIGIGALSLGRRLIKGVINETGCGSATAGHRRRRAFPPTLDRPDGTGHAGTQAYETPCWGGR